MNMIMIGPSAVDAAQHFVERWVGSFSSRAIFFHFKRILPGRTSSRKRNTKKMIDIRTFRPRMRFWESKFLQCWVGLNPLFRLFHGILGDVRPKCVRSPRHLSPALTRPYADYNFITIAIENDNYHHVDHPLWKEWGDKGGEYLRKLQGILTGHSRDVSREAADETTLQPTCKIQVCRSVCEWSHGVPTETSIQNACMLPILVFGICWQGLDIQLIKEAEHFIYMWAPSTLDSG